jgi:Zn-finger nucleic acid-binding protein
MKCPHCVEPHLVIAERQGIEIDYCPNCRGVWLDRVELDKLIERSVVGESPQLRRPQMSERPQYDRGHRKGHKSWLHEIFD